MVTNDDGSHAEDGGRSRSWMPWRQAEDSDATTTSSGHREPIRAARHERTPDDRYGAPGRESDQVADDRDGRHGAPVANRTR